MVCNLAILNTREGASQRYLISDEIRSDCFFHLINISFGIIAVGIFSDLKARKLLPNPTNRSLVRGLALHCLRLFLAPGSIDSFSDTCVVQVV